MISAAWCSSMGPVISRVSIKSVPWCRLPRNASKCLKMPQILINFVRCRKDPVPTLVSVPSLSHECHNKAVSQHVAIRGRERESNPVCYDRFWFPSFHNCLPWAYSRIKCTQNSSSTTAISPQHESRCDQMLSELAECMTWHDIDQIEDMYRCDWHRLGDVWHLLMRLVCVYIYIYTLGVNVEVYLLRGQCWCLGWLNIDILNVDV